MSELKTIISNNILPVELRDIPSIMKGEKGEQGRDGSYTQKAYKTYASMLADKASIPANTNVVVNNDPDKSKNAFYTYDGTTFTKGDFDPQVVLETIDSRLDLAVESASDYFQSQVATTVDTAIGNSTVAYNQAIEVTKWQWDNTISTTNTIIKDNSEAYLATIPATVNDAINNTAVEGGVLADTFITVNNSVNQRQINMGFDGVDNIKEIKNANEGMRVYSKIHASNFIFKKSLTSPINNGTVLQGIGGVWEMEDKTEYLASWFATPNVKLDQVLKLQAGYDYAASKGKPFIIDNLFWVNPQGANEGVPFIEDHGLLIRSNSTLTFNKQGILKVIPNDYAGYMVLMACNGISNFEVNDPKVVGDRLTHTYPVTGTNEWAHAIVIYECSDGVINNPNIKDMAGDGIYIGKAWTSTLASVPKNIIINNPIIDGARRNGISLTAGDNVQIIRPIISKVGDSDGITGAFPKACIDVEPEGSAASPASYIRNCIIDSPVLRNSYAGLYIYGFLDNLEMSLHVKGVTTLEGIGTTGVGFFHGGADGKGQVVIDELFYKDTTYSHIALGWNKLSALTLSVNKINHPHDATFSIMTTLNGAFIGKELGNVNFNQICSNKDVFFIPPTDAAFTINGYRFYSGKDFKGTRIYSTGTTASLGGSSTYIESKDERVWSAYQSTATKALANEIWLDPTVTGVGGDNIFMSCAGDYRELKIGLWYKTAIIAGGCNINGLSIKHSGGVYTTAKCLELGGWLRFQNTESGSTRIIDSYGAWTFS